VLRLDPDVLRLDPDVLRLDPDAGALRLSARTGRPAAWDMTWTPCGSRLDLRTPCGSRFHSEPCRCRLDPDHPRVI
jgi:hypothetical protein